MPHSSSIFVLGSLHYDIIVHGPGRPRKGETVTGRAWAPKCGGKGGNQAVSASRAGAPVKFIGAIGDDDFGAALAANLVANQIDTSALRIVPDENSGMSVAIFDDEGDYGAVIVSGSNLRIDLDASASVDFARDSWLVLQSEIPEHINLAGASKMRVAGGKVILNAAPARPVSQALLDQVDILVVNAIEAEMLAGVPVVESLDGALNAAKKLVERCRSVVVTAGGDGCAYADNDGHQIKMTAKDIVVASTHGAGDEFIGALAAALWQGSAIDVALARATDAAATLVSTPEHLR
ncbi:ribokinase [Devosia elaeis]|uniref:Ribokinase n=1 Tax=Devosia elaeis TaxID=1770058 RepID=A0A178HY25_9HYPH|nr:ribokinase [Devosia elaeis]OAM76944.1 ribokinase [Devosia elaeis]